MPYPGGLDDYENLVFTQGIIAKAPAYQNFNDIETLLHENTGFTKNIYVAKDIYYDCEFAGSELGTYHRYFTAPKSLIESLNDKENLINVSFTLFKNINNISLKYHDSHFELDTENNFKIKQSVLNGKQDAFIFGIFLTLDTNNNN